MNTVDKSMTDENSVVGAGDNKLSLESSRTTPLNSRLGIGSNRGMR